MLITIDHNAGTCEADSVDINRTHTVQLFYRSETSAGAEARVNDAVSPGGFLSGVRVLQIGDGVSGSAAVALLAALGAEADRTPKTGRRRVGPVIENPEGAAPAVDLVLDRQKRELDPGTTYDLGDYDIVIVDDADRVPPPTVGVVLVIVSPFGTGAQAGCGAGGEVTAQASGGLLATIEDVDGAPVTAPGYVASKSVGAVAALAALHGLERRNRESAAVCVDVSAQEAVIYTAALPECAHVLYRCPGRAGSGRYLAPSGVFPCRDGYVRITAVENHQWKGLRAALGEPAWATGLDERPARIEHAALINARVTEWTAGRFKAECAELLQAHGVPSTPVNHPAELLTSPQLVHRGSLQSARLHLSDATVLGPPWTVSVGERAAHDRQGLTGLHVTELTHVLAGPIVGSLLGAMGADVVRLEDPDRLDIYRRSGPFADGVPGPERGAYFAVANHSKRSVQLDSGEAAADVAAILSLSDVLIENVGNSRLDRIGVDPAALAATGRLVLRVSGFGSDGPLAGFRVYANNVQSYGGLAGLTTAPDGTPARLGTVLADPLSSVIGALVIAAWAIGPCRSRGAVVDLSMAEVVAFTVSEFVAAASTTHGADNDQVTRRVHRAADGRWVVAESRAERGESVRASAVASLIAGQGSQEAVDELRAAGLEAAVVRRADELVADPHLVARGFFPEIAHPDPELGTERLVGLPWRFAGEGPVPLRPPPALGSSNADYPMRMTHADNV